INGPTTGSANQISALRAAAAAFMGAASTPAGLRRGEQPIEERSPNGMDATGTEILLVEDSTDFARMYRLRLEMDGHRVRIAGTGAEAIAMASASWPDLILLDVDLPDMDGFQVFAELRARHIRPRVVFLTITDSDDLIGLAVSMGAL